MEGFISSGIILTMTKSVGCMMGKTVATHVGSVPNT